jgi:bifunctional enzyme CysN/CysC
VAAFDTLAIAPPPADRPLRLPIQDVYRFDERRIFAGRVESGTIRVGDRLVFCPGDRTSTVKSIERWQAPPVTSASAGESIGITLDEQIFVERGSVAALEHALPYQLMRFEARLLWLGGAPLRRDRPYPLKLTTQTVECSIECVHRVVDASTLQSVSREDEGIALLRDDVGEVTIRTTRLLAFDAHAENAPLGRFVLMDEGEVAGGGVVLEANYPRRTADSLHAATNIFLTPGNVTAADRAARNGHEGWIVWLTGLSSSGKSTIAADLERELFLLGRQVCVVDGDNLRHGLCSDLGFAEADRIENVRRAGELAALVADAGLIVITALISPYRAGRAAARASAPGGRFLEVYVNAPIEVCEARDTKGLYAKARAGRLPGFTGISSPYEPPLTPEIEIRTDRQSVEEGVAAIVDTLRRILAQGKMGSAIKPAPPKVRVIEDV